MTSKPSVTNCPSALFRLVPVGRHIPAALHCFFFLHANLIQVAIAPGFHLFPFRTEKLSPVTPMVLRNSGRVGSRRLQWKSSVTNVSRGTFRLCTARPRGRPSRAVPLLPSTSPSLLLPCRASLHLHAVLPHLPMKCFLISSRSTASYPHEVLRQNLRKCCVAPKQYVCPLSQVFLLFCKRKFSFCLLFRFLSLHLQCTINLIRYASLVRKSDRPSARRMEGMGCW